MFYGGLFVRPLTTISSDATALFLVEGQAQTYTYIILIPYLLFTSYQIMWTLISLPLQMAERLGRVQLVAVANHVKARQSLIERAVT